MKIADMILFSAGVVLMIASFLGASGAWGSEKDTSLYPESSNVPASVIAEAVQHISEKLDAEGEWLRGNNDALFPLVNDTVAPHLDMKRITRAVLKIV